MDFMELVIQLENGNYYTIEKLINYPYKLINYNKDCIKIPRSEFDTGLDASTKRIPKSWDTEKLIKNYTTYYLREIPKIKCTITHYNRQHISYRKSEMQSHKVAYIRMRDNSTLDLNDFINLIELTYPYTQKGNSKMYDLDSRLVITINRNHVGMLIG